MRSGGQDAQGLSTRRGVPLGVSLLVLVLCALAAVLASATARAGILGRADLERRFGPPLHVGELARDVPIWPITSELEPEAGPVGYVFESIDFAPIPGFEGTPINLLVALDRRGNFIDVEVLRQHEPVFLSGLGEAPLKAFVAQYAGHNVRQEITVSSAYGDTKSGGGANRVVLDGVTKATASVRIVNQTVLAAALATARARLGFAAPRNASQIARPRLDAFEPLDFAHLLAGRHVARLVVKNREVEKLFAGSDGAETDQEALDHPDDTFAELYVAYVNAPTIGRSLLGDKGYARAMTRAPDGQPLLWIASAGRYAIVDDRFVPGTVPPRLSLSQGGLPLELRDGGLDLPLPAGAPLLNAARLFVVPEAAGLDPASPVEVALNITRAKGQILPRLAHASVVLGYTPPAALFEYPPRPLPEWLIAWQGRWPDLAAIGVALVLLSVVLAKPRAIARRASVLRALRAAFLLFTLCFIGWYAQGQLSIVQITGAVKSLAAGQGLASFLYDPVSLLLIAFTLVTFVVWGRGTFCGWLCPFGALQEFVAMLAQVLRLPQKRLPPLFGLWLARSRYLVLAVLVLAAALAPQAAERMVEIEPFKTAITVGFDRTWPYVAYAVALLLAGAFYYKFFCRYLCPLGAAITLGGKLRRFDWLVRRRECGQPCQTCRHRCTYDAIERSGAIRYDECFQCLDCVGIYHDAQRCAPVLLYDRKGKVISPRGAALAGRRRTEPARA